jgi:hypothetical protein
LTFFIGYDDGNSGGTNPHWYDGLGSLNEATSTVTVAEDTDLDESLIVPENWALTIDAGVTLTVTRDGDIVGTDNASKVNLDTGLPSGARPWRQ